MIPLRELTGPATVVGFTAPTAVMASVEYESHPGGVILVAALLAGAAGAVALANALSKAFDGDGQADAAEADVPPSARTPLFELPPGAERDAGFIEGQASGYRQGYNEGYAAGYQAGAAPSSARHGAETRWDMAPVADTAVIGAVDGGTAEQVPADPWRPPPSETAVVAAPKAPNNRDADLYAHPSLTRLGPVNDSWFRPAQRGERAA